jgi:tRNA dimethylallyltransferase
VRAIAIVGPTASGKSDLALALAHRLGGEIVSCDSMQIYRRLDIGTAKPSPAEREGILHHMIDVVDPDVDYSAAEYGKAAREAVSDILSRGALPIVCGGTGLYLEALRSDRHKDAPGSDPALRADLMAEAEAPGGAERLHRRLAEIDPETAEKVHPNNLRRVVRALELALLTGIPKSRLDAESREGKNEVDLLIFCLCYRDRTLLAERINRRVDRMVEAGLLSEVEALWRDGLLAPGKTAEQAIGYRQLIPYLSGELVLAEAVENIKTATRRYAKRQMTWFRRTEGVRFVEVDENGAVQTREQLADLLLPQIREWLDNSTQLAESAKKG